MRFYKLTPLYVTRACLPLAAWLAVMMLGCDAPAPKGGEKPQKNAGAKKLPTRDEVTAKLMGKSKADVLKVLGKPDRTSPVSDGEMWVYDAGFSYDPVAQKPDGRTFVWFDEVGRVRKIDY